MSKVQLQFKLQKPLNENILTRIADAHTIYGIFRVKLNPAMDGVSVEFDASRLAPDQVQAALASGGIPLAKN